MVEGGMKEIKLLACCILFRQWYITPACSYKMRQASLEDWEEKEAKPTILHLHLHCLCISKTLDLNIRPDIDDGFSFTFSLNMHKKLACKRRISSRNKLLLSLKHKSNIRFCFETKNPQLQKRIFPSFTKRVPWSLVDFVFRLERLRANSNLACTVLYTCTIQLLQ